MPTVVFEERAVAFIDVLGFKSVVENHNESNTELLEELVNILQDSVPQLDQSVELAVPEHLIPKHISISDSIILSAPLTSNSNQDYCGLAILVMRAIQLTHIFLMKGYLIRGGISIDQVWHSDSNIVGPAYQNAYKTETQTSEPRIELDQSAKNYWIEKHDAMNRMCLSFKDCFMVNGLHDYYIQSNSHNNPKELFESYKHTIQHKINSESDERVQAKWRWFNEFLDAEMEENPYIQAI